MAKQSRKSRKAKMECPGTPCLESKDGKIEEFQYHKYLTQHELDQVEIATSTIEHLLSEARSRKEGGAPVLYRAAVRKVYEDALTKAAKLAKKSQQRLAAWEEKKRGAKGVKL